VDVEHKFEVVCLNIFLFENINNKVKGKSAKSTEMAYYKESVSILVENEALAKDGEGAGRGPCGLRNSELGPRPHEDLS